MVLPVKPPARGKSRLVGLSDVARSELAAAFALDTVTACLATPQVARVMVATDDVDFSRELTSMGCVAIPDGVAGDLNGTLRQSVAEAGRRWPGLVPVALCADLPALVPDDLAAALSAVVAGEPSFVADTAGLGTTMYTAAYDAFEPRFGIASRHAHEATGARGLPGRLTTLRRDVDDLDDLLEALALGVGQHTARVVARLGIGG